MHDQSNFGSKLRALTGAERRLLEDRAHFMLHRAGLSPRKFWPLAVCCRVTLRKMQCSSELILRCNRQTVHPSLLLPVLMPDYTRDFSNLSGDVCNPQPVELGATGRFE